MPAEVVQASSNFAPVVSAVAAVVSVVCAVLSFRMNRSIRDEAKSDDRIVVGKPLHPDLRERDHSKSVIQFEVFNKSKRKAFIDSLAVYDSKNRDVDVTWSGTINELGTPQSPSDILGITDASTVFIRRNDGEEFEYARVTFKHSFSDVRSIVIFDSLSDFIRTGQRG